LFLLYQDKRKSADWYILNRLIINGIEDLGV
jgi:hypothetical protein